eukprot:gene25290-30539_t
MSLFASSIRGEDVTAQLSGLIDELHTLSPPQQRAVCSILGAATADAAIRPFHWVYNRTILEETVGDKVEVEFWPTSMSPFYTLPTGHRSCYNDLSLAMLRALPENAAYAEEHLLRSLQEMFAEGSEYDEALRRRKETYDPAKRLEERQPVPGPWMQSAVANLLDDLRSQRAPQGSPQSRETDGLCCSLPLIARCAVRGDMDLSGVLETVRGPSLALACDMIVAARNSVFVMAY